MRAAIFLLAFFGAVSTAAAQTTNATQSTGTDQAAQASAGTYTPQTFTASVNAQSPVVFEIAMRRYAVDGRASGVAGDSAADGEFQSYVWTNRDLCTMAASDSEPSGDAGAGWHFSGRVMSRTADQLVARIEWRRVWENGAKLANSPSRTSTITLRSGERVELDRLTSSGTSSCGTREMRLEAAMVTQPAYRLATTQTYALGARGGRGGATTTVQGRGGASTTTGSATTGAGRGGRGGSAAGQATTTNTPPTGVRGGGRGGRGGGATTTAQGSGRGQATATTTAQGSGGGQSTATTSVQGGRGGQAGGATTKVQVRGLTPGLSVVSAGMYDAELWLVHRRPDGTETVQQQTLRFSGAPRDYAFPPIAVTTSRGAVTIDVTGRLQVIVGDPPPPTTSTFSRGAGGTTYTLLAIRRDPNAPPPPQRVMLTITRRARAAGSPTLDVGGGSQVLIDLPKPEDVLSFEFPQLQKSAEDLLRGHTFSLRVRVTPVR
jgi:hypothetical protein